MTLPAGQETIAEKVLVILKTTDGMSRPEIYAALPLTLNNSVKSALDTLVGKEKLIPRDSGVRTLKRYYLPRPTDQLLRKLWTPAGLS